MRGVYMSGFVLTSAPCLTSGDRIMPPSHLCILPWEVGRLGTCNCKLKPFFRKGTELCTNGEKESPLTKYQTQQLWPCLIRPWSRYVLGEGFKCYHTFAFIHYFL